MKATLLEVLDLLYSHVKGLAVSGGVYKLRRPLNSTQEDIVLNGITLSQDRRHQQGTCNVNIYVPNLETTAGSQPDILRLEALAQAVGERLDHPYGAGYNLYVESAQLVEHAEEHYYNLRVRINVFKP